MTDILYLLLIPAGAGVLSLLLPRRAKIGAEIIGLLGSAGALFYCVLIYLRYNSFTNAWWRIDGLSRFILLFCGIFGFIITLYSLPYMRKFKKLNEYYGYLLFTIAGSFGVVLANNLILFLALWGFLGLTLYLLVNISDEGSPAAKKTMIIVGGADCLMIFGIVVLILMTFSFRMDQMNVNVSVSPLAALAFVVLALAAFAKAGVMPMHTWMPDYTQCAPTSVAAYLPASLNKLLGIYLLMRLVKDIFKLNNAMQIFLLAIGAFTIIAGVMMALIQHDVKRVLSYDAISQVGYMVLGIGTLNSIGFSGGLFHMLNSAIFTGCLFLTAGSVEHRSGTTDLDKLGGLSRYMPVTFIAFIISALAISGVPPLNGFFSKWMIYQGIIKLGEKSKLWILWIACAMFGSALTLASFMKLLHAIFLGQKADYKKEIKEVNFAMLLPQMFLAALCFVFGIWAFNVPLSKLIYPAVGSVPHFVGWWEPCLATILIIVGILIGAIIYVAGKVKVREEEHPFIGGEILPEEARITGVDFYKTVEEMCVIRTFYGLAKKKLFDIYELCKRMFLYLGSKISKLHTGVLTSYIGWIFFGFIIILFVVWMLKW